MTDPILTSPEGHLNEAASPAVYSIFTGRKPYLDEYLAEQGKLVFIDQLEKVSQIKIEARDRRADVCGQKSASGS